MSFRKRLYCKVDFDVENRLIYINFVFKCVTKPEIVYPLSNLMFK